VEELHPATTAGAQLVEEDDEAEALVV
jgi:hypothetical protein